MVVGVVVLLIAAIAFANQGGGRRVGRAGSEKKPDAAGAGPTAATGTKPVQGKNGTIASGFAQTSRGRRARRRTTRWRWASADMFEPDEARRHRQHGRRDHASADAPGRRSTRPTPTELPQQTSASNDDGSAASGLTFVSRTIPVGTKVDASRRRRRDRRGLVHRRCSAWQARAPPSRSPTTGSPSRCEAPVGRTATGRSRLLARRTGPAPVDGDNRASTRRRDRGAVEEYGGFTYAR